MIPAEYIKTFLPVHELDEVKPASGRTTAPVQPNDLFLMTQISAYATGESNAVAVSKKINYKNLSEKLSDDFSIEDIKLSVQGKIQPIEDLSNAISSSTRELSDAIQLSASALSTYADSLCSSLSTTVESDYIKKRDSSQTCCFAIQPGQMDDQAMFATSVEISDGLIIDMHHAPISDLIVPKDWHITYGGIRADLLTSYTIDVASQSQTIEQPVSSDCYVNCMVSANENDTYGPLEVWISSKLDESGSQTSSTLYATLNNPGGFSGKPYFNNYNVSIPLKGLYGSSIVFKYQDGKYFNPGTCVTTDCYYFYAMVSKDDLSAYAKKQHLQTATLDSSHIWAVDFNSEGMITAATSVYFDDATDVDAGLVKVGKPFEVPNYGLRIDNDGYAYTEVSAATSSVLGTTKYNYSPDSQSCHNHNFNTVAYSSGLKNFLSCGLEADADRHAVTFIPCASNTCLGAVKLDQNALSAGDGAAPLSSYLGVDENGTAYVQIPYARYDEYGYPIPGIIRTGRPDTTSVRIIRSVYLDDDGIAKVNVVNPSGVGPYTGAGSDAGYSRLIDITLSAGTETSSFTDNVQTYYGGSRECSAYGKYVFSEKQSINGAFMAQVVYDGIGVNYNGEDPCLQIICDGIAVTTLHPSQVQGAIGKQFAYSTSLGVFPKKAESLFAAISDQPSFTGGTLHFLVKEINNN